MSGVPQLKSQQGYLNAAQDRVPQILQQSYTLDALSDEHQWYVFFPHTAALHADGFVIWVLSGIQSRLFSFPCFTLTYQQIFW